MSSRDELANLIASVTIDIKSGDVLRVHPDGETPVFEGDQRTADALIAAGWRPTNAVREIHVKTCEISGANCKNDDCPLNVCGPCGEKWPCPTIEALDGLS